MTSAGRCSSGNLYLSLAEAHLPTACATLLPSYPHGLLTVDLITLLLELRDGALVAGVADGVFHQLDDEFDDHRGVGKKSLR
jgi:hypothetical protein